MSTPRNGCVYCNSPIQPDGLDKMCEHCGVKICLLHMHARRYCPECYDQVVYTELKEVLG